MQFLLLLVQIFSNVHNSRERIAFHSPFGKRKAGWTFWIAPARLNSEHLEMEIGQLVACFISSLDGTVSTIGQLCRANLRALEIIGTIWRSVSSKGRSGSLKFGSHEARAVGHHRSNWLERVNGNSCSAHGGGSFYSFLPQIRRGQDFTAVCSDCGHARKRWRSFIDEMVKAT